MRKFMFGYFVGSVVSLITASYIWNFDILVKKPKIDRKYASVMEIGVIYRYEIMCYRRSNGERILVALTSCKKEALEFIENTKGCFIRKI